MILLLTLSNNNSHWYAPSCFTLGRLRRKRGNDLVQYRPCRPKSMEMPTEAITSPDAHVDDATECVYRRTTDAPGKSKVEKDKAVNKTASLSFSSGEDLTNRRRDGGDDESSSYFTQSIYTQSIATPSLNGYSTTFTTTDEGTNYHDDATFTSHSALTGTTGTISMFGMDDDEISAILDADESESANDSGSDHWSKSYSKSSSRDSCRSSKHSRGDGTTSTDDRYRSSFSGTSGSYSADESEDGSSSFNDEDSESSVSSSSHDDGDNETWEEIPECGTLINVKPKINERVSRLTPDHTSHLIRSRFRKKHFPKGSFPYDK